MSQARLIRKPLPGAEWGRAPDLGTSTGARGPGTGPLDEYFVRPIRGDRWSDGLAIESIWISKTDRGMCINGSAPLSTSCSGSPRARTYARSLALSPPALPYGLKWVYLVLLDQAYSVCRYLETRRARILSHSVSAFLYRTKARPLTLEKLNNRFPHVSSSF